MINESKNTLMAGLLGVLVGGLLVWAIRPSFSPMMNGNDRHMGMDMSMSGMMMTMSGKTGDAFDKAFLEAMIVHHEGAVEMAKEVKRVSKRPELLKLADEIISAQTKEINMMKGWLGTWFAK